MRKAIERSFDTATARTRDPWLDWLHTRPALWLGTLLAAFSVFIALRNSILHALDLQWSPTRLLAAHIDPWQVYLAGDPAHRILRNQVPNYLHELYLWTLPLGYLPESAAKGLWALCNLIFISASCACIARLYELRGRTAWLFTLLVLTSTPFRVTLGNGQVTALVLLSLALWACVISSTSRGALLGLAWIKYSVPPVLAVYLLLCRRWRVLLASLLLPAIGFFFCLLWLQTRWVTLLLEPFRCSTNNVSPGLANIMAVCEIALRRPPLFDPIPDAFYLAHRSHGIDFAPYLCGIALAVGVAVYLAWRGRSSAQTPDSRILLACLTAASLLCFKHQIYDFLLLSFALAAALRAPRSAARNTLLGLIAYFWYAERLLHIHRWEFWPVIVIASFVALAVLIGATWKLRGRIPYRRDWTL